MCWLFMPFICQNAASVLTHLADLAPAGHTLPPPIAKSATPLRSFVHPIRFGAHSAEANYNYDPWRRGGIDCRDSHLAIELQNIAMHI